MLSYFSFDKKSSMIDKPKVDLKGCAKLGFTKNVPGIIQVLY